MAHDERKQREGSREGSWMSDFEKPSLPIRYTKLFCFVGIQKKIKIQFRIGIHFMGKRNARRYSRKDRRALVDRSSLPV